MSSAQSAVGAVNSLRGLLLSLFIGFGLLTASAHAASTTLIASNSNWRYLADGSDQGTAWRDAGFDDSGWSDGMAKLGFGGDGEVTTIGFATNGFTTFYFRRSFVDSGANLFSQVLVRLLRDDGAVVYLNGVELFRHNMPAGAVNHLTLASTTVSGAEENTFFTTTVPAAIGLLQPGINIVAVEVHQVATNSSDLGFDFELTGVTDTTPPGVTLTNPTNNATFVAGENITLGAAATDDTAIESVAFYIDGGLLGTDTTVPYTATLGNVRFGTHNLIAVAQDIGGLRATSAPVAIQVILDPGGVTLLPNRSCWRYWDRGTDLGSAWMDPDYDDSAWLLGFAELGYGDGDEATVVGFGPNASDKYITTYFRRRFSVASPETFTNLVLRLKRDDGAVVYLNGSEVFRDNLPAGPINHLTLATLAADDGASYLTANVSPLLLTEEENTLAVEIHQTTYTSSDISFDLQLIGQVGLRPPPLRIATIGLNQVLLAWPVSHGAAFALEGTPVLGPPAAWMPSDSPVIQVDDEFRVVETLDSGARFFRLTAETSTNNCQPPVIVTQTASFEGVVGTNFTLSVVAAGDPNFSYQWRLNSQDIAGATNSSYSVVSAQTSHGGEYDVLVGNSCGCAASCPIPVTISSPDRLSISLADVFADRASLANLASLQINSTNAVAGSESGEPGNPVRSFGRTVWLEWMAPGSGVIEVDSFGSGSPASLAVYTGAVLSNLVLEASAGPGSPGGASRLVFNAASNTAYQIQLDNPGPSLLRGLNLRSLSVAGPVPQFVIPPRRTVGQLGQVAQVTAQVRLDGIVPDSLIQYQWRTEAGPIPGETNASLTFPMVQKTHALGYSLDAMHGGYTNSSGFAGLVVLDTGVNSGSVTEPTSLFINQIWCKTTSWDRHRIYLFRLPISPVTTTLPCTLPATTVDQIFQPATGVNSPMTIVGTPTKLRVYTDTANNPQTLNTCVLMVRHKKCNATCGVLSCYDNVSAGNLLSDGTFTFPTCTGAVVEFIKIGILMKNSVANPNNVEWKFQYLP